MKNNMLEIIQNDIKNINVDISKFKDKTILITGATGLIGTYLSNYIVSKQVEYNITIYLWIRHPFLGMFRSVYGNCEIIMGDITDKTLYEDLPQFDYIIHLAGYGQPNKFLIDKIKTIEINTMAVIWLFEKLKKDGTFLFMSSSEVYDGLDEYDIPEEEIGNTNTDHARACYIESKKCGEAICHAYREQGVNVKIIRLSLTYGPGTKKDDTRVLNSLIHKAIEDKSINLLDAGDSIRTYCYITDSVEMSLNVLLFSRDHTYNIGGTYSCSILELAKMIGKKFKKHVYVPADSRKLKGSPKIVNICIDKYLCEFDKVNFVTLEDGLDKTIEWQKQYNNKH